jgi:hypothetical protein
MLYENRNISRLLNRMRKVPGYRPSCQAVFLQLMEWENAGSGTTQPAQGVLARETGLHRVTVNRAVAWLRLNGFLRTVQRFKRIGKGAYRYLSLKYWVAKELGQVAFLEAREKTLRVKLWAEGRMRRKFSCSLAATAPSTTESYSSKLEPPKRKKNALEGN